MKSFLQFIEESSRASQVPDIYRDTVPVLPRYQSWLDTTERQEGINRDHLAALRYYTTSGHSKINGFLRGTMTDFSRHSLDQFKPTTIRDLDDLIQQHGLVTEKPLRVYRSIHKDFTKSGPDLGFLSTSLSKKSVYSMSTTDYSGASIPPEDKAILAIDVPKGVRYIPNITSGIKGFASQFGTYSGEQELIFGRGHHLEINQTPNMIKLVSENEKTSSSTVPVHSARLIPRDNNVEKNA